MAAILKDYNDVLTRLYVEQDMTLNDVIQYMHDNHGVNIGKSTYERYLKTCGIRKRERGEVWASIDYKITKRARSGRKSDIRHNGETLTQEKVQKEIARHVSTYQQCTMSSNSAPSPMTPAGFSVATPGSAATPLTNPSPAEHESHYSAQADTQHGREYLLESLVDSAAFVISRASKELPSGRASLLAFHQDVADSILAAAQTHTPQSTTSLKADLQPFKAGFDILLFTYEKDEHGVQEMLQHIDKKMFADVLKACLSLAAGHGSIEVARILLTAVKSTSINVRNAKGRTFLHIASLRNQPAMVEFLVQQGADVNKICKAGETPWTAISGRESHEAVSQALIRAGAEVNHTRPDLMNGLYQAAAGGHVNDVRIVLRRGADPSYETPFGWAPLHFAQSLEIVQLLVEAGANVNAFSNGNTPLDMHYKNEAYRDYLIKHGGLRGSELLQTR